MSRRVGLIGAGSIAQDLVSVLSTEASDLLSTVLVRPGREAAAREVLGAAGLPGNALIVSDLSAFLDTKPEAVAECASHSAVSDYGVACLQARADLITASVGALADAALLAQLTKAARENGVKLIVPPGAIGGIDMLSAARLSGLSAVTYTGRKPPAAWAGTPAEAAHDLQHLTDPTMIFDGTAREAAQSYPKNANVAATLALAGMGMDATRVTLIADPTTRENVHEFSIRSGAVESTMRLVGKPSPRNPKTSQLTALSMARAVLNSGAGMVI